MISIQEFEEKVWELEGIRLIVRGQERGQVEDYEFQNAAQGGWSITKWITSRVAPRLNDYEAIVIMGNGEEPNGRTLMRNVKASYHVQL